eukprot:4311502-Pyramimonas_sp.AAC.1
MPIVGLCDAQRLKGHPRRVGGQLVWDLISCSRCVDVVTPLKGPQRWSPLGPRRWTKAGRPRCRESHRNFSPQGCVGEHQYATQYKSNKEYAPKRQFNREGV